MVCSSSVSLYILIVLSQPCVLWTLLPFPVFLPFLFHEFNLCLVVGPALDSSLSLSHPGGVTYVVMSVTE